MIIWRPGARRYPQSTVTIAGFTLINASVRGTSNAPPATIILDTHDGEYIHKLLQKRIREERQRLTKRRAAIIAQYESIVEGINPVELAPFVEPVLALLAKPIATAHDMFHVEQQLMQIEQQWAQHIAEDDAEILRWLV